MFERSPHLYDAIYSFKDYEAEADKLATIIERQRPGARTILDVACGTGKHIELLRERYDVEGLDIDANLLEIAQARNPEVRFHAGDMITFDLGRTFDVVMCLFSSIGYVQTPDNLLRAMESLARHVAPGGLLLVEPWFTPDVYEEGFLHMVTVDHDDIKVARIDGNRIVGGLSVLDLHYLVGTAQGVEHFTETHRLGLFSDEQYRDAIVRAGLQLTDETPELSGRGLYVALRPR